jgi:ABC-type sugar transport system ATPase subunit
MTDDSRDLASDLALDSPGRPPLLELRKVSKRYGAVRALHSVDLNLGHNEVLGIVGDNGAGKSTLVGVISGLLKPDHGEIFFDGTPVSFRTSADAQSLHIETVFQSLSLISSLDIVANLYLNREPFGPGPLSRAFHRIDKRRMKKEAAEGFSRLGVSLPALSTKVSALSGGQRQAVAISRAILWECRIVILDEPTAALGVRQTEMVLSFIERLKSHGVSVILISHNMEHVLRVCDRVAVMRLGECVYTCRSSEIDGPGLVGHITAATSGSSR